MKGGILLKITKNFKVVFVMYFDHGSVERLSLNTAQLVKAALTLGAACKERVKNCRFV